MNSCFFTFRPTGALRSAFRHGLLVACLPLAAFASEVATPDFLSVVANAPVVSSAAERVFAARERIGSAARLPDPQVEGMGSRMNGPMGERVTMWEVNVRQPLPRKGELGAARERASAVYDMALADYGVMAGEVAAETAMALAEAEGALARRALLETQVRRLESVLRSVEQRLATGNEGRLAERLTVQTRIASMKLMMEEEAAMAAAAQAEARGRLGLAPEAALPVFNAPLAQEVLPAESAALKVAEAKAREAGAMGRMARASTKPMTAVGVRFERARTGMGDEDTVGLVLMSDLPWHSRGYARAEVRAAEADRAAAVAEAGAVRHGITATLAKVARAEQLAISARRFSGDTLVRLEAENESLLSSAGVRSMGASTVLEIVELLEKATETELRAQRAEVAARVARAGLWRHMPVFKFKLPTKLIP